MTSVTIFQCERPDDPKTTRRRKDVNVKETMILRGEIARTPTISLTCPILALFALVFFGCIASDGKAVGALSGYTPIWNETWTDRLKRDLLLKYDKFARPAHHFNTTVVYFDITVLDVSLDDFKSSMIVQAWIKMKWIDEKLKWNASKYGDLTELYVGNHEVWQPDIRLYNSVTGSSVEYYGDTHCIIYPDGTVFWTPPTQFHALCDLDLRLWPFDTQTCHLKLGSWMYLGDQMDLRIFEVDEVFNPDENHQYTEWRLMEMTKNRTSRMLHDYELIKLIYNLTIKRHSPMYYATVVAPAGTIVFLILVIFWLPPRSSEKILLCGCTALIISVFLIHFGHKVPPLAGKPPLLICFYSGSLYLATISLIISAFVINLSRRPHCRPLPRAIKKLLVGRAGQYLALSDNIQLIDSQGPIGEQELRESRGSESNAYHRQTNSLSSSCSESGERENIIAPTTSAAQLEWILAATAIDRLAFLVFSIIFAIMAMVCLA